MGIFRFTCTWNLYLCSWVWVLWEFTHGLPDYMSHITQLFFSLPSFTTPTWPHDLQHSQQCVKCSTSSPPLPMTAAAVTQPRTTTAWTMTRCMSYTYYYFIYSILFFNYTITNNDTKPPPLSLHLISTCPPPLLTMTAAANVNEDDWKGTFLMSSVCQFFFWPSKDFHICLYFVMA